MVECLELVLTLSVYPHCQHDLIQGSPEVYTASLGLLPKLQLV